MARNLLLRQAVFAVHSHIRRNFGISSVCFQKAAANLDPIQKIFVDKLREYNQKSKSAGGKLIDATPEFEQQVHDEMEKLKKQYGSTGADFIKFPSFNFTDPVLEAVDADINVKAADSSKEITEGGEDSYDDYEEIVFYEPIKTADWWATEKDKYIEERKKRDEKFNAKYLSGATQ